LGKEAECDLRSFRLKVLYGFPTKKVIEAAPKLKLIAQHALGYDNIDLEAAAENKVLVTIALGEEMVKAFTAYKEDVKAGRFPLPEHCYNIPEEEFEKLLSLYKNES